MQWLAILQWFQQNREAFFVGISGVAGWFSNVAKNRLQSQRNAIDAEQLENEQLALALNRERFLTDRLNDLVSETEALWRRLYDRESVIKEYHSAALGAQRLLNELEIKVGRPVTLFPDLPEFPPNTEKAVRQAAKEERGEPYDNEHEDRHPSLSSSPMGRGEAPIGKDNHRTPTNN
ncbi:hypothetical protein GS501_02340 [Saccharibacter sp. 17.LH.SD]|uniref:hypothetical protein n=1 Tax=Saccharibacter sp. 17.LH.SD TaxID=2689393 RepID=UPI0013692025|nr:hypothetical protein [Saccharibacter sp. 17.LH.SD]MXV43891.1 hypothetical protein [Saccharibacter sp. 17.LH.SD]